MTPERIAEIRQRDGIQYVIQDAAQEAAGGNFYIEGDWNSAHTIQVSLSIGELRELNAHLDSITGERDALQQDNARLRAALVQARQSIAATYEQTHFMFLENDLAAIDAALEDAR